MKSYLTNGSKKYWMYIPVYPEIRHKGVVYNINGSYQVFNLSFVTEERLIAEDYEVPIWELKEDSVLIFGENSSSCKIEYLNDDVLILNWMQKKGITVWFKCEDQLTEPVADTTHSFFPRL